MECQVTPDSIDYLTLYFFFKMDNLYVENVLLIPHSNGCRINKVEVITLSFYLLILNYVHESGPSFLYK